MSAMYIKLTRANGDPIWINASFIVTIEPNVCSGGSIVVPIGDGLDYEVKESPEAVLAMLDGAPAPAIIPVPASDALKKKSIPENPPLDITGSTNNNNTVAAVAAAEPPAEEPKPVKKATKRTKAKTAKKEEAQSETAETAAATKKKTASKARARKKAPLTLDANELERLRKLAPKSLKKLHNTISTQFKTVDPKETVDSLKEHDIIKLDGDHVIWSNLAQSIA